MKLTKAILKKHDIHNPHNLARACGGPLHVFVCYSPQQTGRAYRNAKWQVVRIGYNTDAGAHWMDGGCRTFNVFGREDKEPQRLAAIEWATKRYGITEWVRDCFGDYQAKTTIDRAMQMCTQTEKSAG